MRFEEEMRRVVDYADGKLKAGRIDNVGIVLFNQPEKRNAVSLEMWEGLCEALDAFAADDGVRVVIYAGAGDKAFMSGADISQFADRRSSADANAEYILVTGRGRDKVANFPKPSIACIHGFCLGAGLVLAMRADLRIASADAQLGLPATKVGLAFAVEATENLVQLVGPARAKLMIYTARRFTAMEAREMGLVDIVAGDDVASEALELARTIGQNAPLSIATSKFAIDQVLKGPGARDVEALEANVRRCMDSADYREGRLAFLEKRKPAFTGT